MMAIQVCTRCLMDSTDPDIVFYEDGTCNHCNYYMIAAKQFPMDDEKGKERLNKIVSEIKLAGRGKEYDCIIGVSGGVDSSYVAYLVKNLGLRPLAVHLDNGWNSELAVSNVEKMLNKLGIDLHTHVINWHEFKDLQLAFLKASVPHSEHPTDHAIMAIMYEIAAKKKIKYIISGNNMSTEGINVKAWSGGQSDWKYIRSIHKMFGTKKLKTYPHFSFLKSYYYKFVCGQRNIKILNFITYNKQQVMETIKNELSWKYYGGKHYESIYTRFFQGYILPTKFNIDKRKAHLSSLICSGQMTREEALKELEKEICPPDMLAEDREYVIKKLGLTEAEFEAIMKLPAKSFNDYPSYENSFWFIGIRLFYQKVLKPLRIIVKK